MPFIVWEGGDGAGKTTQIKRAKSYLESLDLNVVTSHEPFDPGWREKLLDLTEQRKRSLTPEEELKIFCIDRKNHVKDVIKPVLEEGHIFLEDRFEDSTIAYQGYGRRYGDSEFIRLIREKSGEARQGLEPDLVILYDIDPEIGLDRIRKEKGRTLTTFEKEKIEFHKRVRDGFLQEAEKSLFLSRKGKWQWCIIDASLSEDEVWGKTKQCIDALLRRQGIELPS